MRHPLRNVAHEHTWTGGFLVATAAATTAATTAASAGCSAATATTDATDAPTGRSATPFVAGTTPPIEAAVTPVPEYVLDAAGGDPAALGAIEFVKAFDPHPGVDYGWLEEHARRLYEQALGTFDLLDAKAGAVIGHVGVGAGFATFGTAAAATSATVPPLVLLAAIPTVALAASAVWNAAKCRRTEVIYRPPAAIELSELARDHPEAKDARAYLVPQWHLCTALLGPVLRRKAKYVDTATRDFALAVLFLAFPLAAIALSRLTG